MKNCRIIQNRLGPFMDREVSEREAALIKAHLTVCPDCMGKFEGLKKMTQVLKNLEVPPPPLFLSHRIMARARKDTASLNLSKWKRFGIWGSGMPQWVSAAALGCGIIIGTLMGVSSIETMREPMAHGIDAGLELHHDMTDFLCGIHGGCPPDLAGIDIVTLTVMKSLKNESI